MTTETTAETPASVDDGIHAMLSSSKERVVERLEDWENCVREHPVKAVVGAAIAGALILRLPLRSILIANVRIASALAPPALFAYGAAKLVEILQQKSARAARAAEVRLPEEARF